jgi:hypothetical protein
MQSNPARMATVVDLTQLDRDLASGNVADYNFIAPDQCNDMHGRAGPPTDPCNFGDVQGLIATGDAFLHDLVGKITSSPSRVIFVTWDESDFTGSGPFGLGDTAAVVTQIPAVAASSHS